MPLIGSAMRPNPAVGNVTIAPSCHGLSVAILILPVSFSTPPSISLMMLRHQPTHPRQNETNPVRVFLRPNTTLSPKFSASQPSPEAKDNLHHSSALSGTGSGSTAGDFPPGRLSKPFNKNKKLQSEVDLLREEIARLSDTLSVGLRSHAINSNSADI